MCLSPLALKVSGGWSIRLEETLALQLRLQKGQRKTGLILDLLP